MQPVTIPMTSKDENDNVSEYRVVPLIFEDKRFRTIMDQLGKELRTKFMKLYKRTSDAKSRTPAIEMSSWLAVFAAEQLIAWYSVLVEVGQKPDVAALNTFKIFGDVFEQQTKAMTGNGEEDKKDDASEGSEEDSDVPEDAESASEEAGPPPDSGGEAEPSGQAGEDANGGEDMDPPGEVPQDARSEADRRDPVDDDSTSEGN